MVLARIAGLLFASALLFAVPAAQSGRTYYVNCDAGNDAADGLSPSSAWNSLAAVSRQTFQSGDAILFRRGSVCEGMLAPKGSGSAQASIRLDAWGTGPLPQIHAQTGQEAAVKLFNQEYWTIRHLEFSGGDPYGVFISGNRGILHGIEVRDVVIHDVTGQPKTKESGLLVIINGSEHEHFDHLLIDGVTAYHTTQWAGILVAGVGHGFPPESSRNTNVVIRNSLVHDVAGDGIVLFEVNNGLIENSAAWLTGMQETETIGTPNAIWTWMCRNCTVRHNEAFLTDSPGVDGGAFDIDYGNDDNVVEENYGHDTQGYCVAVFGAGWVTTNSAVRKNICAANGLSPRLARRQGAVFLSTWNGGKIRDLTISDNLIFWDPPVATAAVVNIADFIATGKFEKNTIHSCSPLTVRSNSSLIVEGNSFGSCVTGSAASEKNWRLQAMVSSDAQDKQSRGEIALLESVHRQFPQLQIQITVTGPVENIENLRADWNTGGLTMQAGSSDGEPSKVPRLVLTNASGKVMWSHDGFTAPGKLGLALRMFLGNPEYAKMAPD